MDLRLGRRDRQAAPRDPPRARGWLRPRASPRTAGRWRSGRGPSPRTRSGSSTSRPARKARPAARRPGTPPAGVLARRHEALHRVRPRLGASSGTSGSRSTGRGRSELSGEEEERMCERLVDAIRETCGPPEGGTPQGPAPTRQAVAARWALGGARDRHGADFAPGGSGRPTTRSPPAPARLVRDRHGRPADDGCITAIAFSPDGRLIAAAELINAAPAGRALRRAGPAGRSGGSSDRGSRRRGRRRWPSRPMARNCSGGNTRVMSRSGTWPATGCSSARSSTIGPSRHVAFSPDGAGWPAGEDGDPAARVDGPAQVGRDFTGAAGPELHRVEAGY